MALKLDKSSAIAADSIASGIRESGKFIGVITRAEKLSSEKGTQGLGLSFKADSGATADYLDLWHTKGDGEALSSMKTVNAVMCCAKVAEAADGTIVCEKWDAKTRTRVKTKVPGYPALMDKRIGLLLRKVLESDQTGKDREKLEIFGVFNADTELTASEMFAKKTSPERLTGMLDALMAKPVIDKRDADRRGPAARGNGGGQQDTSRQGFSDDDLDDSCPF